MHEDSAKSVGGHLALDFTNTISWDPKEPTAGEQFGSFEQLLDWTLSRGLLSRKTHGAFARRALETPDLANQAHIQALALRAAMHEIFSHYAVDSDVSPVGGLATLNQSLEKLPLRLRLLASGAAWDWAGPDDELIGLTWPIVWSAVSLLTSPQLLMVKQCAGDRCGWLFVDESRRHNRKWCDMRDCGNRAKARRHYYRNRESS